MSANGQCVVEVEGLSKVFGAGANRIEALRGISLRVAEGEFIAILGASGSGKSTLLHLIGGLDLPSGGRVRVQGEDLGKLTDDQLTVLRRRRIGFVFQAFNLLDLLTAQENVALPLVVDGVAEAEANRRASAALASVNLTQHCHRLPPELSGGEQQRVAIARALVSRPLLLLADEPTGSLDSASSAEVVRLLRTLVDQHGQTVLLVTHDARQAASADRLLRLRDGQVVDELALPPERPWDDVMQDLEASP